MNFDIRELAEQALVSRTISRLEQQFVSTLLFKPELGEHERTLVARLSYGIRRGLLQVVE